MQCPTQNAILILTSMVYMLLHIIVETDRLDASCSGRSAQVHVEFADKERWP